MRNLITLSLFVLVTACGTISANRTEAAKQQVAEATATWVAAYNSRDPGRITSLYDSEAVFWGTSAKTIAASPAAIANYFKDAGKTPEARVTLGEQHIRVYGDVAINTGYYTFRSPARFTFVYRNRNGKWLIVDHHSSRVPG
jgi:uncharacterized protein (TIGR02246 family)